MLGLLWRSGWPSRSVTRPPADSTTHCAAAVSHSEVGPRRGYTSAAPSATRHSLSELPRLAVSYPPSRALRLARNLSTASPRCERLPPPGARPPPQRRTPDRAG